MMNDVVYEGLPQNPYYQIQLSKQTTTSQGNRCTIYARKLFNKNRVVKLTAKWKANHPESFFTETVMWRCPDKKCKATVKTMRETPDGPDYCTQPINPDHIDACKQNGNYVLNKLLDNALVANAVERQQSNRKVYADMVVSLQQKDERKLAAAGVDPEMYQQELSTPARVARVLGGMATPNSIGQRVGRRKRKDAPPEPKEINGDTVIPDKFTVTNGGDNFLLRQVSWILLTGAMATMWVFGNLTRLREMFAAPRIFMDGTFKLCPAGFSQFYSLHYFVRGSLTQIPGVFALFTHKSEEFYNHFFTWLRDFATEHEMPILWVGATCDFELAVMNSLLSTFHEIQLFGCLFHFNKAVWAKFGEFGLQRHYKDPDDETDIKFWLKCIFSLPYLRADRIRGVFQQLMLEKPVFVNDPATTAAIQQFLVYLHNTYLGENARFNINVWCVYVLDRYRTNNNIEGWNHGIQYMFRASNTPGLWTFLDFLKEEDSMVDSKIALLAQGNVLTTRKPAYRLLEQRLKELKRQYTESLDNAYYEAQKFAADMHYVHSVALNQADADEY